MAAAKHALRRTMRQLRHSIPHDLAQVAAERAAVHLLARGELADVDIIGLYSPIRDELSTAPLIEALAERGVALAFPRVVAGKGRLVFHRVTDLTHLVVSAFGIPEPDVSAPVVPVENIDAFVVPGLAFDRDGWRLGWGKGHYDQTLAECPNALRIGYCFDAQVLDAIPAEDHDLSMQIIATETSAIKTGSWTP